MKEDSIEKQEKEINLDEEFDKIKAELENLEGKKGFANSYNERDELLKRSFNRFRAGFSPIELRLYENVSCNMIISPDGKGLAQQVAEGPKGRIDYFLATPEKVIEDLETAEKYFLSKAEDFKRKAEEVRSEKERIEKIR